MENRNKQYDIDEVFEERVKLAVAITEREHLMSFILELEEAYQNSTKKASVRSMTPRRWMSIAAAFLVLASAFFVFRSFNTMSSNELVAMHYEPYPNVVNPITRSQPQEVTDELRALLAYEGGRYKEALSYLDQIEEEDHILMFKAISSFEIGDSNSAKAELKTLINANSKYLRPAQWYMGLILLKEGDIDHAKEYFKILAGQPSDSSYQKDASDILKQLK
jgi:tetratricopeptide (TPR) repeat protein